MFLRQTDTVRPVGSSYPNAQLPKARGGRSKRSDSPRPVDILWDFYNIATPDCRWIVRLVAAETPYATELPGRSGRRKRRRGASAPLRSLPGSVAFPQWTAQDGLRLVPHNNSVGHVRRAAVIATYKGLCGRRQPMNCCTFMIFTELCGDS